MGKTNDILNKAYNNAEKMVIEGEFDRELNQDTINYLKLIGEKAESSKGVITVLMTLIEYKIENPEQDIRYHQTSLPNGFSGRSHDTAYITPFLKEKSFPSPAVTGWLTRSLEQPYPYTLDYEGRISPKNIKKAFLGAVDMLETQGENAEYMLEYLLYVLIKQRDAKEIKLIKPTDLPIFTILNHLYKHFEYPYKSSGAARLPVLAIYSAYECMVSEMKRFEGKELMSLESHTSSDSSSGRIGDIDVWNIEDETPFEGVEVKHDIVITPTLVNDNYQKFSIYPTQRYYLLTTANMSHADWIAINEQVKNIKISHGCQVIVNGVYDSLKYYLRMIEDPTDFIKNYVELLESDQALKFEHKKAWNDIVLSNVENKNEK